MPALERRIGLRGPKFWLDDEGQLMFVNQLDASTRDGPRPATPADKETHIDAFMAMERETDADVLKRVDVLTPPGAKPAPASKPYAERRNAARESV